MELTGSSPSTSGGCCWAGALQIGWWNSLCLRPIRTKILNIATDGEPTMTGHIQGVQTRFEEAATGSIFRVWCGLHQLDLAAQKQYEEMFDGEFTKLLTGLIGYLRRQPDLISDIGKCPTFASTRWLSMPRVTEWLMQHRAKVVEYLEQKNKHQSCQEK